VLLNWQPYVGYFPLSHFSCWKNMFQKWALRLPSDEIMKSTLLGSYEVNVYPQARRRRLASSNGPSRISFIILLNDRNRASFWELYVLTRNETMKNIQPIHEFNVLIVLNVLILWECDSSYWKSMKWLYANQM
jgi:hypothetical protein